MSGPSSCSADIQFTQARSLQTGMCAIHVNFSWPAATPSQTSTHGAIQFAAYEELKHFAALRQPDTWSFSQASTSSSLLNTSGSAPRLDGAASPSLVRGKPSVASENAGPPSGGPQRSLSAFELSVCAATSKLMAAVGTYPSQVDGTDVTYTRR